MPLHFAATLRFAVNAVGADGARVLIHRSHHAPDDPTLVLQAARALAEVFAGHVVEVRLLGPQDGAGPFQDFDLRAARGHA